MRMLGRLLALSVSCVFPLWLCTSQPWTYDRPCSCMTAIWLSQASWFHDSWWILTCISSLFSWVIVTLSRSTMRNNQSCKNYKFFYILQKALISVPWPRGSSGDMRDNSAEIPFSSFLQDAFVSSSSMGRDVHSFHKKNRGLRETS